MEDGKWPLKYLDFAYSGLFVCNEPQNGWTDRAHILCGMGHKGLWIKEISKLVSKKIWLQILNWNKRA